ncbi:MAG: elongation factor Ts [Patescibacteria group bacterium]
MVSVQQIKALRESTGAGISDVKKALEESGGDMEKATSALLRALGSSAEKRAGRETKAGIIEVYSHANGRIGAMAHMSCETDFVARNPEFKWLAHEIAMQIAAMDPADVSALYSQPFIKDAGKTVGNVIDEAIGRFGENIKIERFTRYDA